ncbi:MAG: acyl-CoA dehydrogenase family protein, partial [Acidobacteria bacterium]|nr:acyl-CoA dehydrogenase family protein [Acidobacteriota bacterium]
MDFQLNDEQQQLRRMVREFAECEIGPRVMEWDKACAVPLETILELGGV